MSLRAAVLLVALALTGCNDDQMPAEAVIVRPVKLFTVTSQSQNQIRQFPAQLRATDEVAMSFRRGGYLKTLPVREGQTIKKGQLLAEIDDKDLRVQLRDRQATYDLARAQFQRFQTLNQRQLTSRAELDQRKAQMDSANAALSLARHELTYSRLLAPFDGVVARVAVQNHHVVQAMQGVVILHSSGSLDVTFQLQASLMKEVSTEAQAIQARVMVSRIADRTFAATYKDHSTAPDPGTLTYTVTYTIERPKDLNLLPGMSATVELDFSQLRGQHTIPLVIPAGAVFAPDSKPGEVQVWVAQTQDERLILHSRRVELGQLTLDGIQVLSGLEAGDRVVAAGGGELHEGQEVREWTRERGM